MKRKKKPALKFNPGLALTGVRTTGPWLPKLCCQGNVNVGVHGFEINFREKKIFKYVHVQVALPKKNLMCCFCDEILLAGAAVPLFNSYK